MSALMRTKMLSAVSRRILPGLCQNQQCTPNVTVFRCLADVKRFYKDVNTVQGEDGWEINLDKRKLKTLNGALMNIPTEGLAIAIATEWANQGESIKRHNMYLTWLAMKAIDNPTQKTKEQKIETIIHFFETDTVCYRLAEPDELAQYQAEKWDPVIDFVQKRYDIHVECTDNILKPETPAATIERLKTYLSGCSEWALEGYLSATESLKSLVITLALMDRLISVEEAVSLARLEVEYQIKKWGNVEWYHDTDLMELRARVAAATLHVHLSTNSETRHYIPGGKE